MSKIAPELVALYEEYSSHSRSHHTGMFRSRDPLLRIIDDRVVIDAVASGNVDVLKSDLESLGLQRGVAFGRIVSGELPIVAIPAMAELASLNFARSALPLTEGARPHSAMIGSPADPRFRIIHHGAAEVRKGP
jgi:hypothetical protein